LTLGNFIDTRSTRLWSALIDADPLLASRRIYEALSNSTIDERLQLEDNARRQVVWALVRLAWPSDCFPYAAKSLALLAEAENETWGNNATGEFIARFKLFLGGTSLSYDSRLHVLDNLFALNRTAISILVIRALTQVMHRHESRFGIHPVSTGLPESEWHPENSNIALECVISSLQRLTAIAQLGQPALEEELTKTGGAAVMMLRQGIPRKDIYVFLTALKKSYPSTREPLRRSMAHFLANERQYWKDIPQEVIGEVEKFIHQFEENSLPARLEQNVGESSWPEDTQIDLGGLAQELLNDETALRTNWPWLTSGKANDGWRLGEALGVADLNGSLEQLLPVLPNRGKDDRLITGYIRKRRESRGDIWYAQWFKSQSQREPVDLQFLVDVIWRCGSTDTVLSNLTHVIKNRPLPEGVADVMGFGRWHEEVSFEALHDFLNVVLERDQHAAALVVLRERIRKKPTEHKEWRDIAGTLLTNKKLIKESSLSFQWRELSENYFNELLPEIIDAILSAHLNKESGFWSIEYSDAKRVLHKAVEIDAAAVWEAIANHLSDPSEGYLFTLGFQNDIIDQVPQDKVLAWVRQNPELRASLLARIIKLDFANDDSLAAILINEYGHFEEVGRAFSAAYGSGTWGGTWASWYNSRAKFLAQVAKSSTLPKLREWSDLEASNLRRQAEELHNRDQEDELRH
jgi:hypothetical protein